MRDIRLALITGIDIPFPECETIIHQPKLKEIALLGETEFFTGVQCLYINKKIYQEDESLLQNLSNFQIFMKAITDPRMGDKKENTIQVLSLLFPNSKVVFLPNSIIFTQEGKNFTIDEINFDLFQEKLLHIFCLNSQYSTSGFNPSGKKAKEIADKLNKARQKVAEEHGEGQSSVLVTYISCLATAQKLSLTEINELTLFQLYDQIERFGLYTAWDIDTRVRLAGGKPDDKPENWMKNIH